ncbi:MAG: CpsD/CapB family tyrosine-protein kinase [Phycisphaerae bacterium]
MGRIAEALKKAEHQRAQKQADAESPAPANRLANLPPAENELPDPTEGPGLAPPVVSKRAPRVQGLSESLVPYYEPSSVISEQYRGLRTRLLNQNPDNEHRIIGITSGAPRDGKSVTAANTAFILSEIRHLKVLVVDGDFRRSSLGGMLNMPKSPGLADVLRGEATYEEAMRETPIPNLSFMPAGDIQDRSAAEILSDEKTGSIFARFQREFHYTIVDTPPATTVTDVGIIGQWCNGVIMVVRINRTPEPIAQRAVRVLQVNNVPILGVLLVGNEARAPGYGYYRYYNYYRSYYTRDDDKHRR